MYSIVLMAAMTAPADAPQGIIFNRPARAAGCQGVAVQQVRVVQAPAAGCSGFNAARPRPLAAINEARPHLFGRVLERRADVRAAQAQAAVPAASSCGGGFATFRTTTVTRATVVPFRVVASGCAGSSATFGTAFVPMTALPCPADTAVSAVSAVGKGPVRRLLLRAELAHAINVKERRGEMTAAQAEDARRVMADPELRGALLARIEAKKPAAAMGDHPFLDWFVQNWGSILQMIKDVLALFTHAAPEWAPMPRGPLPQRAVVPQVDRWLAA